MRGSTLTSLIATLKQQVPSILKMSNPSNYPRAQPLPPLAPTHAQLIAYLATLFPQPPHPNEVPYIYHTPRPQRIDPKPQIPNPWPPAPVILPQHARLPVQKLILAISPTPGVYTALATRAPGYEHRPIKCPQPLLFLHRPWQLDRRRLPRGMTVLSCHKGFDEVLTVGWNVGLARRLGVEVGDGDEGKEVGIAMHWAGVEGPVGAVEMRECALGGAGRAADARAICVKGYKGDPHRRIGLVGLVEGGGVPAAEMLERVEREFEGVVEASFGFENHRTSPGGEGGENRDGDGGVSVTRDTALARSADDHVKVVAIMNAFHPEEVERVAVAARQLQSQDATFSIDGHTDTLYLTGAVREPGLEAARAKGMKVVCVGHRACEEWGIRYLAETVRKEFPMLYVETVSEEEEQRPKKIKTEGPSQPAGPVRPTSVSNKG